MAYTETEARGLVVEAGHRLLESGLIARTWGNISARVSETEFIITPSGMAYDTLRPDDLVRVNITDLSHEGKGRPSSEKGVHAAAYRLRGEVNFVIHTHQDAASVVSVTGRDVAGLNDPLLGARVPCAGYGLPSTKKLTANVEAALAAYPDSPAVLMKHHGTLCAGRDFDNAFAIADALEKACAAVIRDSAPVAARLTIPEALLAAGDAKCVVWAGGPAAVAVSREGRTLRPLLDDLAQIAGADVRCANPDPGDIARKLRGRNAVLVRGYGAICTGDTGSDAEAVRMIVEKGCRARLYAETVPGTRPLSPADAALQRLIYLKKYSKLKK
ncbi:MAG TPA: class II aldolase/adducin family protein [Oscillospiraceae bacterium]|nr:class II aldolase/adducin family protein [Oscillospiraceae bacterium]